MKSKNLKLIARTDEDLRVISAHLQDSIISTKDIANLKKNKIFLKNFSKLWLLTEKTAFFKDLILLNKFAFETAIAKS